MVIVECIPVYINKKVRINVNISAIIVITTSGDGIVNVDQMSKEDLSQRLIPDEDGCCYYGNLDEDTKLLKCLTSTDPMYWGRSILIIKGDVVVPIIRKVYEFNSI